MKLFITRHGETDWNTAKRICGVAESQLTERGHAQARDLAERLAEQNRENNIRYIYVSPLKRARDTAFYIEKALDIRAVPDIRIQEVSFGEFEGMYWDKTEAFWKIRQNPFTRFTGGESLMQAAHRAYGLIDEIKCNHKNREGNVLFVCHGLITALMCAYFKDFSLQEFFDLHIDNCQLLEFEL